jgi:NDP-sugar pyrophosphorylase family protein
MKAIILSAGFGTRLKPFSEHTPKPLFTLSGKPIIDVIIRQLQQSGCTGIVINTHHLSYKIDAFLSTQHYDIPVCTRYEPEILGTGGAIKHAEDVLGEAPFLVINSDIVTDIDFKNVYDFHMNHNYPATLVLHDFPRFNKVSVNRHRFITDFGHKSTEKDACCFNKLAFTGIHVIDPMILDVIPENTYVDIIDIYNTLLSKGEKIKAFISKNNFWKDIGTPESYKEAVVETMSKQVFNQVVSKDNKRKITTMQLAGDGSDRLWYRVLSEYKSIIMADHGIRTTLKTSEVDSFVLIGQHLYNKGICVPEIHLYDTFSGVVFMEDLSDNHLQDVIIKTDQSKEIIQWYQAVIDRMIQMNISGMDSFDVNWSYQTHEYDTRVILDKECRYFVEAFLKNYLRMDASYEDFEDDFDLLAKKALEHAVKGLMHRDMQSRNIMVVRDKVYFIDFQGARIGPVQYDLASLLIDPYVNLPWDTQQILVDYCIKKLSDTVYINAEDFRSSYTYCSIARNLQMLGAFGYLIKVKGKTFYEQYIPTAVMTLKNNLKALDAKEFPLLKKLVENSFFTSKFN